MKHKQALRAIENCACVWVTVGETIRDLSLAESIMQRNLQAHNREPLPLAEIHGLKFKQPANAGENAQPNYQLIAQANEFCAANAG